MNCLVRKRYRSKRYQGKESIEIIDYTLSLNFWFTSLQTSPSLVYDRLWTQMKKACEQNKKSDLFIFFKKKLRVPKTVTPFHSETLFLFSSFACTSPLILLPWGLGIKSASPQGKEFILTLRPHAHTQTFLKSTLLALAPHIHIYFTAISIFTLVHGVLRDAPPEEALAALTRERVIVVT